MILVTRVQVRDKDFCVSSLANSLGEGIKLYVPFPQFHVNSSVDRIL